MKKIDVIVIGGSGTLGRQIVKQCLKNNKKILNLDLINNNKKKKIIILKNLIYNQKTLKPI